MAAIRGDRRDDGGRGYGLRLWEDDDLVPRADDVFQERLYCVRWRPPPLDALLQAEQHARASLPFTKPVPDWVDLDRAIASLIEAFDAAERQEIATLRERDWLAEDRALRGGAPGIRDPPREGGRCPKYARQAAARRLREAKEKVDRGEMRGSKPWRNRFQERCIGRSVALTWSGRPERSHYCASDSRTGGRAVTSRAARSFRAPRRMSQSRRAAGRIGITCSRHDNSLYLGLFASTSKEQDLSLGRNWLHVPSASGSVAIGIASSAFGILTLRTKKSPILF